MNRKIMPWALLLAWIAVLVPSALASAQEIHIEGITTFSAVGSASELRATGEPTPTCEATDVTGTINSGGTTGTMNLDITGCHMNILGFTIKCRTAGSALDNTVNLGATFHLITYNEKPAVLFTPTTVNLVCAGTQQITISGNSIATITSPKCGATSKTLGLSFTAAGVTQDHRLYTGVEYDLKFQTGGGSQVTAATTQTFTVTSTTEGKLNCT